MLTDTPVNNKTDWKIDSVYLLGDSELLHVGLGETSLHQQQPSITPNNNQRSVTVQASVPHADPGERNMTCKRSLYIVHYRLHTEIKKDEILDKKWTNLVAFVRLELELLGQSKGLVENF